MSSVIPPFGIHGDLVLPEAAQAVIVFAHGSGSSRHSPRNRMVARDLQGAGLGTLLLDLLTETEERTQDLRFDIELLAERLTQATDWLSVQPQAASKAIGYFGASTGAAAALVAATQRPAFAVVSRGGRPDLAGSALTHVTCPTLLIVGSDDREVLELNWRARQRIRAECQLSIVPGATHLFEEPGALDQVCQLAREWFLSHLARAPR